MHGYFMDIRLYKKAKSVADPFEFEQYRKKKIKEKIEEERSNRVVLQVLAAFPPLFCLFFHSIFI